MRGNACVYERKAGRIKSRKKGDEKVGEAERGKRERKELGEYKAKKEEKKEKKERTLFKLPSKLVLAY